MATKKYVPTQEKKLCFRALAALLVDEANEDSALFKALESRGETAADFNVNVAFAIDDNRIHVSIENHETVQLVRATYRVERGAIRRVVR